MTALAGHPARVRVRIRGLVQGVGFRPHVYRQAVRCELSGWVRNDAQGVLLEAQGAQLDRFLAALTDEAPPLSRVEDVVVETLGSLGDEAGFRIVESAMEEAVRIPPPMDAAVCDACLAEVLTPESRFQGYPFLNCTHCGPRFTLIRQLPYDRSKTTMAPFAMCPTCRGEYDDPGDRRFHAQPTACPDCGPRYTHSPARMAEHLEQGHVLAIKGIGGYHLVCDARQEAAVERLRRAKRRDQKPFGVMVANLASAERLVELTETGRCLLSSKERPIVLARALQELAKSVAPGSRRLGVMLPHAPLHYLIFHHAAGRPEGHAWLTDAQDLALVMTSANVSGEPLIVEDALAEERFGGLVEAVVGHDRAIAQRADDSVVLAGSAPVWVRNGRGRSPWRLPLPFEAPPILALGAQGKATICLTRGREAFVSQHLGDLESSEARIAYERAIAHLVALLEVRPEWVVHDLHPDLAGTRLAASLEGQRLAVQHHQAHVAAVMAEHQETGPVLGLALDGLGLGPGGELWGGELLRVERSTFERIGGLSPLALPGGDHAARHPWRMAASALHRLGRGDEIMRRLSHHPGAEIVSRMLDSGLNCPPSSSCGRLFDAAAGLLGIQGESLYEGQAAMRLEELCTRPEIVPGLWRRAGGDLDLAPLLEHLVDLEPETGANRFHGTLIAALAEWVEVHASRTGLDRVVLAGGCMLNLVLSEGLERALSARGLKVLRARELPPSDAALSLGQAYVAAFAIEDRSCA